MNLTNHGIRGHGCEEMNGKGVSFQTRSPDENCFIKKLSLSRKILSENIIEVHAYYPPIQAEGPGKESKSTQTERKIDSKQSQLAKMSVDGKKKIPKSFSELKKNVELALGVRPDLCRSLSLLFSEDSLRRNKRKYEKKTSNIPKDLECLEKLLLEALGEFRSKGAKERARKKVEAAKKVSKEMKMPDDTGLATHSKMSQSRCRRNHQLDNVQEENDNTFQTLKENIQHILGRIEHPLHKDM